MPARPVADVTLALFAIDALGQPASTAPRAAEQYNQPAELAPTATTARVDEERIRRQCADLARLLNTPTDDYQGLRAGDRIEFHWPTSRHLDTAIVASTCLWGALVHPEPGPDGVRPCTSMYVRQQLDYGPYAGAWTS
jgi:hypothetical protein